MTPLAIHLGAVLAVGWARLYEPPWSYAAGALALALFAWFEVRGTQLIARGLRDHQDPQRDTNLVRGVRRWILGLVCLALGGGLYFQAPWAIAFGFAFLGVEMLETGTYLVVLRSARARDARAAKSRDAA